MLLFSFEVEPALGAGSGNSSQWKEPEEKRGSTTGRTSRQAKVATQQGGGDQERPGGEMGQDGCVGNPFRNHDFLEQNTQ